VADSDAFTNEISSAALRSAVRSLLAEVAGRAAERDFDLAFVREQLRLLATALERGEELRPAAGGADALVLPRLLEELRGALLEQVDAEAEEVLPLLRTMESLHRNLSRESRGESFARSLSAVNGAQLVAELAHDLHSPLTSVLFLAETLRQGHSGALNELQYRQLGIIYTAALNLVSMAGDVIELARGGERLAEQRPSSFFVSSILSSVCDLVRPMVEEKEIALETVPPESDHRVGFPVALSRVLLNLTTNAIKVTERGTIEIAARELGEDVVEFSVRDSGPGIDPESVEDLYRPFRARASETRVSFSGTGLGLSICRKLVGAMGGTLSFETARGEGTRFHFSLGLPVASERMAARSPGREAG
jgi:signal transduction histidine kinase